MLGEEIFYILFIPLSAWIVSTQFAVHLTILLAMSVGIGNILKNFFLIPRPPHPPVWVHTESEKDHGLPSTHTMTAITLPWYFIIYHSYLEPVYPLHPAIIVFATAWTLSVMASRIYNGHHTVLDVVAGAVLGITFLAVFTVQLRPMVDDLLLHNTLTGTLTIMGAGASVLVLHPIPPKVLTPAHAETGLVVGTTTGAFLGLWLRGLFFPRSVHALVSDGPILQVPLFLDFPLLVYLLRFLVGAILVTGIRAVVKKFGTALVLWAARLVNIRYSKTNFKYSEAEVAVKYLTYSAVGCGATWLAANVFIFIGLHLPLDDRVLTK
jgi:membrane-associated phospholipid phosphatase